MAAEKLFDLWANRNPQWEKRYEDSIIRNFCDYGRGATSLREERGKVFGGGYEIFIVAFFIGLYFNQKRPLIGDTQKRKTFVSLFNIGAIWIQSKAAKHIRNFASTFSPPLLPAPTLISSRWIKAK